MGNSKLSYYWLFLAFICLLPAASVKAEPVEIYWNPSPSTNVSSYNLYYQKGSEAAKVVRISGRNSTKHTFASLEGPATYFFQMASVSSAGLTGPKTSKVSRFVAGPNNASPVNPSDGLYVGDSLANSPTINNARNSGLFIWKQNDTFHFRMPAGGEALTVYEGTLELSGANASFANLNDGGLNESSDVVQINNLTNVLTFKNSVVGTAVDGFSFKVNGNANLTLKLKRPGTNGAVIFLGKQLLRAKSNELILLRSTATSTTSSDAASSSATTRTATATSTTTSTAQGAITQVAQSGVTFPGTNIRHFQCIGNRPALSRHNETGDWFEDEYAKAMKGIRAAAPEAFANTHPCILKKLRWADFYVNKSKAPRNSAEARNPDWSNYKWTQFDLIAELLKSPSIKSGGAKLAILIADQFSAHAYSVPSWYTNKNLSWEEGSGNGAIRNRLDVEEGVTHLADFYAAFLKRYGDNTNLFGLAVGEYYLGNKDYWPSGFNRNGFYQGRLDLLKDMVKSAPLDSNGNRLAIYQTNPSLSGGVTLEDLIELQVGISYSDILMFHSECGHTDTAISCEPNTPGWNSQVARGQIPLMMNGDTRYVRQGRKWTWPTINNPFGYKKGERHLASPQNLFWYHGSKGVIPLDSIFMGLDTRYPPQDSENLLDAVKKFGEGGSLSNQWGAAPSPASFK